MHYGEDNGKKNKNYMIITKKKQLRRRRHLNLLDKYKDQGK